MILATDKIAKWAEAANEAAKLGEIEVSLAYLKMIDRELQYAAHECNNVLKTIERGG